MSAAAVGTEAGSRTLLRLYRQLPADRQAAAVTMANQVNAGVPFAAAARTMLGGFGFSDAEIRRKLVFVLAPLAGAR